MMVSHFVLAVPALATTVLGQVGIQCPHPTMFYDQRVNHSDPDGGTFKQQYQLMLDYYQPGGPILFYQGAETSNLSCVEEYVLPAWAADLGAAVAQLEHRFFGVSYPRKDGELHERYASLTLDNVLDDSVGFLQWLRKSNASLAQAPIIATGGSYGGFLSALLRLNHPETIYGSIAWAGPINGMGPDDSNPDRGSWYTWVSNVYWTYSATAATKMQSALNVFHDYIKNGTDYEHLASALKLCDVPKNRSDLQVIFEGAILNAYSQNTQFSFDLSSTDMNFPLPMGTRLSQAVNGTLAADGPLEVLNASLSLPYNGSCVDWAASSTYSLNGVDPNTFPYLECRYFPISSDFIVNGTIFPAGEVASGNQAASCMKRYKLSIPTQQELAAQYHFTTEELRSAKRLLFTFGTLDPTSAWAPWDLYTRATPDRQASRLLVVDEGAHTEDAFTPLVLSKPGVLRAQRTQLEFMKEWLSVRAGQ